MISKSNIFAHRGLHSEQVKGNSLAAIRAALESDFSVETDIRDRLGKVVVEHDPPSGTLNERLELSEILEIRRSGSQVLALNVKADGLYPLLSTYEIGQHFFFDMSFPESLKYRKHGASIAARVSEFENYGANGFERESEWIWLDCFEGDWFLETDVKITFPDRRVVLVSPELHGRNPRNAWLWAVSEIRSGSQVSICTDLPHEFLQFAKVQGVIDDD